MVDIFEEVEGELRSEQLKRVGRRLLPWVIAGIVIGALAVGAYWFFIEQKNRTAARASESYSQALELLQAGAADQAFTQFESVPDRARAYKALALMQQAEIRFAQDKDKEGQALLQRAAEAAPGGEAGQVIADAARLKSALAVMDEASYADIEARLKPLTEEGRPYRPQALEALALAKIRAGQLKEARQDFVVLSSDLEASEGIRNRAKAVMAMIDSGTAAQLDAVVKAANALPPEQAPTGLPPGMMIPGLEEMLQQQQQQGAPQ